MKPLVCIGLLGPTLDVGGRENRWARWRPTVSLFQHEDVLISRFELLYQREFSALAERTVQDIEMIAPETEIVSREVDFGDAWDFESVYEVLHQFARSYPFDTEREDYLLHITTGTHVAQICCFLLAESRHIPAQLVQTSPPRRQNGRVSPGMRLIDLDLSKYDKIFERFRQEQREGVSFLKSGIETRNAQFNKLIEQIERVAKVSRDPILVTGPTGAGKTQLARKIYELKVSRRQLEGRFVEVNCATLRGDAAMSTLFGHVKGAYTGAVSDRPGLLMAANGGMLFLDEIGELGLDEQAMLLRALESKRFMPVGADHEVSSDFQLIAGTNRALGERVAKGEFREDLLARINLWSFELPGLAQRREDLEPNLEFELDRFTERTGEAVTFNKEARQTYLKFAGAPKSTWAGNFRDLNASVTRMATLAGGGRINKALVEEEIERLERAWRIGREETTSGQRALIELIGEDEYEGLDRFDRVQLGDVVDVCRVSDSASHAGRTLFAESRKLKKSSNDADRLRKYLAKFGLSFKQVRGAEK